MDSIGDRVQEHIDRVGWSVTGVFPTQNDPPETTPFAYTIGLTEKSLPELLIAGLGPRQAQSLLNLAAQHVVETGLPFTHGQTVTGVAVGNPLVALNVPVPQRIGDQLNAHGALADTLYPGVAIARYGRSRLRLQQLVWPDRNGQFPWSAFYVIDSWVQPVLAAPPATAPEARHVP